MQTHLTWQIRMTRNKLPQLLPSSIYVIIITPESPNRKKVVVAVAFQTTQKLFLCPVIQPEIFVVPILVPICSGISKIQLRFISVSIFETQGRAMLVKELFHQVLNYLLS
jgi:hypothetical protein